MGVLETELLLQAEDGGVGDVCAVQKGEEVEDAEDGDDAEVDFGDEFALGGVRGTFDEEVIVVFGVGVGDVGVVVVGGILPLLLVTQ